MLAIIPTINRSSLLDPLLETLLGDGVRVVIVDGSNDRHPTVPNVHRIYAKWNIYKTWNYGLDLGKVQGDSSVFVLNDDIVLKPGSLIEMDAVVRKSGLDVVSFFDQSRRSHLRFEALFGTHTLCRRSTPDNSVRGHELCGYAFAVNPSTCPRFDEEFFWWCGDDDMFYRAEHRGHGIGIACWLNVEHPKASASSDDLDSVLPYGWKAHDFHRLDMQTIGLIDE